MAVDHRAIILIFVAIMCFGIGDVGAKLLANNASGSFREMIHNRRVLGAFAIMSVFSLVGFASWVFALKFGDLSRLVPIQKLSLIITVILAIILLNEAWSWKTITAAGLATGAIVMLVI